MGSCVSCIICTIDVYRTYILVQFLYFDPDSTIPLQSSWKKLMVYRLLLLLMIWSLLCYVNSCWLTAYFASNFPYCSKPRNRELKNIWPYVSWSACKIFCFNVEFAQKEKMWSAATCSVLLQFNFFPVVPLRNQASDFKYSWHVVFI